MQNRIICLLLISCKAPETDLLDELSTAACDLAKRCDGEYATLYDDDAACARDTRTFLIDFGYDGEPGAYEMDAAHLDCLKDLRTASCEAWSDATALRRALSPVCVQSSRRRELGAASLQQVVPAPFEYVGPGSLGSFGDYHVHPTHPTVLAAAGDPGGIYLSSDKGASWVNISSNLNTGSVWALEFAVFDPGLTSERTRLVLGTDSGVYISNDVASADGLVTSAFSGWTEAGGFDVGDERADDATSRALFPYNTTLLTLPIGAVTVDPSNPSLVWVGVTGASNPNLSQSYDVGSGVQRFDRWKVYRSLDGGQSFEPVLRFSSPTPTFPQTPFDDDGSVFSILVQPTSSSNVWVATDRGLYSTNNATTTADTNGDGLADLSWTEIGQATRRNTTDAGLTWTTETAKCSSYQPSSKLKSWCLPVVSSADVSYVIEPSTGAFVEGVETHPNLRELAAARVGGRSRLYATIWDRGHASDQGEGCSTSVSGDTFHDSKLAYMRGGLYASDDGGETWRWLFTNTGAPGGSAGTTAYLNELHYRCDADASQRSSNQKITFFPTMSVPANQKQKLAALLGAAGAEGGLYAYTPGATTPWRYLTDKDSTDFDQRFEGAQSANLSGTGGVSAARIIADWSQNTAGYPLVMFGARGVLMGTWSTTRGTYEFAHLGSDYRGVDQGGLNLWTGTGLDNAVIWDILEVDGLMYLGISDGGVLKVEPVGDELLYVGESRALWTPNWSTDPDDLRDDESRALAWDAQRGTLYAGTFATNSGTLYAVLAGDRTNWEVIGGYGYTTSYNQRNVVNATNYNGFYSGSASTALQTLALQVVPVGSGTDAELLAGTSAGLFSYASTRAAGVGWQEICADLAHGHVVESLMADAQILPGWAFATLSDLQQGGLLAIRLSDLSCQALVTAEYVDPATGRTKLGADPIRYPTSVGLATLPDGQNRIVVGGMFQAYPGLFSAAITCDTSCQASTWAWPWTGRGVYTSGSAQDVTMRHFDFGTLAVDPNRPAVVWAALETEPAYDYYNPQHLFVSEDGGKTFAVLDLENEDYNLPTRRVGALKFSADGQWLYAGTRASLFRMPVVVAGE